MRHWLTPRRRIGIIGLSLGLWGLGAWASGTWILRLVALLTVGLGALCLARSTRRLEAARRRDDPSDRIVLRLRGHGRDELPASEIREGDRILVPSATRVPITGTLLAGDFRPNPLLVRDTHAAAGTRGQLLKRGTLNPYGTVQIQATQSAPPPPAPPTPGWARPIWVILAYNALIGLTVGLTWVRPPAPEFLGVLRTLVTLLPVGAYSLRTSVHSHLLAAAAEQDIRIADPSVLRKLDTVDTVILDKTGTLTRGEPRIVHTENLDPTYTDHDLIRFAGLAESVADHPIARVFVRAFHTQFGHTPADTVLAKETPGMGVAAEIDGVRVVLGQPRFLARHRVIIPQDIRATREAQAVDGHILVDMAVDGRYSGYFVLADPLRPGVHDVIRQISELGRTPILLSGDDPETAARHARDLRIPEARGRIRPSEKAERIRTLHSRGAHTLMIGDGLNDIPAMDAATVAVALGGIGSDAVCAHAQVILGDDDLRALPPLIRVGDALTRQTRIPGILTLGVHGAGALAVALTGSSVLAAVTVVLGTLLMFPVLRTGKEAARWLSDTST